MARRLHLTAEHVARVPMVADPGPAAYPGTREATDADYDAAVEALIAAAPPGEFWIFAYGSLIWNPATEFEAERIAVAQGWHRNFCLHDLRYRGNPAQPGLMLCLDRGGACRGVAYRLPPDRVRENMDRLIRREMSRVPNAFPGRWIRLQTETGPLTALTFVIDRRSPRYVGGLSLTERAARLAAASGWRGSMAEYLHATVTRLEALGIHDRNLWTLQRLVAEQLDRPSTTTAG